MSHCFQIDPNHPEIQGLPNVLAAYRKMASEVKMAGPTCFAPVFNKTIELIEREARNDMYYILMILTDGEVHDMKETIEAIVKISNKNLPVSVIICGIGHSDFANMVRLDGDDLCVAEGAKDIIQFVKFNEIVKQSEPGKLKENLAAVVLEEVPEQLVECLKKR